MTSAKRNIDGLLEMHNFQIGIEQPLYRFLLEYFKRKTGILTALEIAKNSTQVCYEKVDFPSTVKTVFKNKINTFIEIGANSTCTNWINEIIKRSKPFSGFD